MRQIPVYEENLKNAVINMLDDLLYAKIHPERPESCKRREREAKLKESLFSALGLMEFVSNIINDIISKPCLYGVFANDTGELFETCLTEDEARHTGFINYYGFEVKEIENNYKLLAEDFGIE